MKPRQLAMITLLGTMLAGAMPAQAQVSWSAYGRDLCHGALKHPVATALTAASIYFWWKQMPSTKKMANIDHQLIQPGTTKKNQLKKQLVELEHQETLCVLGMGASLLAGMFWILRN